MVKLNLHASKFDPCLFMNDSLIIIIYVDDILIYAQTEVKIDSLIEKMKNDDIALHKERIVEG